MSISEFIAISFNKKHSRIFYVAFSIVAFLFISISVRSQGCSDAGLCSFGSLSIAESRFYNIPLDQTKLKQVQAIDTVSVFYRKTDNNSTNAATNVPPNTAVAKDSSFVSPFVNCSFTTYYGIGENNTAIFINQLEGNFKLIDRRLYAQIKLPYSTIVGKLGSVSGLSDITMSLSYVAFEHWKSNLSFAAGVKIPSNNSDLSKDNRPLPMVYQTSLGSTDILLGSRFTYRKWDVTVGYQHSFNANANHYLHIPSANDSTVYNAYFESNGLRRADDGLFRINRKINVKKMVFNTGLLFIYHIQNDDITDFNGNRIKAVGSQGLTLNFDLAGKIPINKKLDFTFVLAKPLKQRKYVDDGLARSFVGIIGLRRNF